MIYTIKHISSLAKKAECFYILSINVTNQLKIVVEIVVKYSYELSLDIAWS